VVRRALQKAGYQVLEAASGTHALQLVEARGGGVDALIADLRMPSMSGRELVRQIRSLRRRLPVLYISGYTEEGSLGQFGSSERFLGKPFSVERLIHTLRGLLSETRDSAN